MKSWYFFVGSKIYTNDFDFNLNFNIPKVWFWIPDPSGCSGSAPSFKSESATLQCPCLLARCNGGFSLRFVEEICPPRRIRTSQALFWPEKWNEKSLSSVSYRYKMQDNFNKCTRRNVGREPCTQPELRRQHIQSAYALLCVMRLMRFRRQ